MARYALLIAAVAVERMAELAKLQPAKPEF
jgi:hypothetical protein